MSKCYDVSADEKELRDLLSECAGALRVAAAVLADHQALCTSDAMLTAALNAEAALEVEPGERVHVDEMPFADLSEVLRESDEEEEPTTTNNVTIHLLPGTVLHISSLYDR